jgi:predicted metal-dependent hydrolase
MPRIPRKAFFHVGLPKTATTFLQRRVFPHFEGVGYLKKHAFDRFPQVLAQRADEHERVILSFEFHPYPGEPESARRLGAVRDYFEEVYPILALRRHASWVRSRYKYHLRKHGRTAFADFVSPHHPRGAQVHRHLDYMTVVRYLEAYFGRPPLLLFHHELVERPRETVEMLARFTGARVALEAIDFAQVNSAYSERRLKWLLRFNRLYPFHLTERIGYKPLKKSYRKLSQGLLHGTAFLAGALPDPQPGEPLIDDSMLETIDRAYHADWEACLAYAAHTRARLLGQETMF